MSRNKKRLEALEQRTGPTIYEFWSQDLDDPDLFYTGSESSERERSLSGDELTAYAKANPTIQVICFTNEGAP
jgi:hypothetical protein